MHTLLTKLISHLPSLLHIHPLIFNPHTYLSVSLASPPLGRLYLPAPVLHSATLHLHTLRTRSLAPSSTAGTADAPFRVLPLEGGRVGGVGVRQGVRPRHSGVVCQQQYLEENTFFQTMAPNALYALK